MEEVTWVVENGGGSIGILSEVRLLEWWPHWPIARSSAHCMKWEEDWADVVLVHIPPKGDGTVISCRALHCLLVQVIHQTCVLSTLLYMCLNTGLSSEDTRQNWEGTVYHIRRNQMMLWQQVYVKTQAIKHITLAMLQCCDNMLPTTATGNVTIAASNRWATLCKCLRIAPFFIAVHNQAWWETQEETVR